MDEYKERHLQALYHLPGVTPAIADALYDAGYKTKPDIFAASDSDLKKIQGLTNAKVNTLRNYQAKIEAKALRKPKINTRKKK